MATSKTEKIYIQFKQQSAVVYEGDRFLSITVTRSKAPVPGVAMSGEIHPATGSTAKKGKDFIYDTGKPVVFSWAADDVSLEKTVTIPVQENSLTQGDRVLILHESKFVNCFKGPQHECRVVIKDGVNPSAPVPLGLSTGEQLGLSIGA